MSRSLSLLGLSLFLAACGKTNVAPRDGSLNVLRLFSPALITEQERTRLSTLCQALAQKAQALPTTSAQRLQFEVQERPCSTGTDLSGITPQSVPTLTEVQAPSIFRLRRADNNLQFILPELETNATGSMAQVCSDVSDQTQNPRRLANGSSLWVNVTNPDPNHCRAGTNEICIQLETGVQEGGSERIIKREFIRFQMDRTLPRYGFWTERELESTALCGIDLTSQIRAKLVP